MSQNEPKINPATGYVHDDSQLEEKRDPMIVEPEAHTKTESEEKNEAAE